MGTWFYALSTGIGIAIVGCGDLLGIDEVGYGSGGAAIDASYGALDAPENDDGGSGGDPRDAGSGSDAPVYSYDSGGGPDTSVPDAATDTPSSFCPCPAGTTGSLGDCTLVRPLSNEACGIPLAVPLCTITLHFELCPTDPTFIFVNGTNAGGCAFDGGCDARVAAFFRLASHTASYHVVLNGSGGGLFSVPNGACTASNPIICVDVPASVTQPVDGPMDGAEIVVGKGSSGVCDAITLTITPL